MDAVVRVVKYLKGSIGFGILLPSPSSTSIFAYCNSDWVFCPMSRRSLIGFCVKLGDSLLSWRTKKQNTVSRSSVEAEYRAMATTTCVVVWIRGILNDMGVKFLHPTTLYCDNKASIHIAAKTQCSLAHKNIEIDCHLVRKKIK